MRDEAILLPSAERADGKFSAKNEWVAEVLAGGEPRIVQVVAGRGSFFFHWHFLPVFSSRATGNRQVFFFAPLLCHSAASFLCIDSI